ncbi:hypothetical protein KKF91_16745, partial [Myxococcota bacterium]|nr:hypothetical protein [Myxococcota bacterium]
MNKLLLVLGVVLLASLGKLNNAFVWDDIPLLVKSDLLYDWANLPVIFGHDTMYAADGGAFAKQAQLDTYRPITLLTFMLDAHLGGRDPLVFHLSSLLYHLLAVAALWLLLARLWRADWAWLPAACFGLHPLLGEAHLWINGRSDVLAGLFGFTALWLSLGRGWRPALGGALFLLGLMSKEVLLMALPVWALAMAWGWGAGFSRARLKAAAWALSPLILAALLYLGARAAALGGLKSSGGPEHLLMALGRVGWLLLDGLQSLALPLDTSLRYLMEDYARHATARFALSWLALLLALAALLRWRRRAPLVLIGLSLYAALLAPAALITGLRWYGFGRYLYLPFAGLLLALAPAVEALLSRRPQRQRPLAALMAIYLLGCGARLYVSADQWDGDLSMYEAIIAAQPDSSHGYGGVGRMLIEAGNYPAAAEMLIKAS